MFSLSSTKTDERMKNEVVLPKLLHSDAMLGDADGVRMRSWTPDPHVNSAARYNNEWDAHCFDLLKTNCVDFLDSGGGKS